MNTDNIKVLSELEKQVILTLARNGPMSGYDFHLGGQRIRGSRKAIMSSGSWYEIKQRLGSAGEKLINNIQVKGEGSSDERGRRKDLVWLTPDGVIIALINDADKKTILNHARKVYPEDEQLLFSIELTLHGNKDLLIQSYLLADHQFDKLDLSTLRSLMLSSSDKDKGRKKLRTLILLGKKYPKVGLTPQVFRKAIEQTRKQMNDLLDVFQENCES